MIFQKVILNGIEMNVNPTDWKDNWEDTAQYKRALDGTLLKIGGVKKFRATWRGTLFNETDLQKLENIYLSDGVTSLVDIRGRSFNVRITGFNVNYTRSNLAIYEIEVREI